MIQVGKGLGTHVKLPADVWNHRYETLFEQVRIFHNSVTARKLLKTTPKTGQALTTDS